MRQIGIVIVFFLAFTTIHSSEPIDYRQSLTHLNWQMHKDVTQRGSGLHEVANSIQRFYGHFKDPREINSKKHSNSLGELRASQKYFLNKIGTPFSKIGKPFELEDDTVLQTKLEKYPLKFGLLSFAYLYVALIGFYIAIMINLNRKTERIAKIFISSFVFVHSFFIFHIFFNLTNYHFVFPHSYRMSTIFSFLYGPLLYFYFKRITQQYEFKKRDAIHLIPTVLLLIYLIPIYSLPLDTKLNILLERENGTVGAIETVHTTTLVILKLSSLTIYGYFIRKLYCKSKKVSY